MTPQDAEKKFPSHLPFTRSSDAHFPEDVGKCKTTFYIAEGTTREIKKAFLKKDGRHLIH
jgi:hypothetical protein